MKKRVVFIFLIALTFISKGFARANEDSTKQKLLAQYSAAINYADAAINSIAALNSLIKKENYRNKISSYNNPTSSDMGFNLHLKFKQL